MTLGFDRWLHGHRGIERNRAAKSRQRAGQRSLPGLVKPSGFGQGDEEHDQVKELAVGERRRLWVRAIHEHRNY
jgi:hypothetical protein